jgi:DNA-3-methyladenine glycosylase
VSIDLSNHSTTVAPALLGSILHGPNGSGTIVEVEAYGGREDLASHAVRGPTKRTRPMFGRAGVLYVYLVYGMYHCANVVTGSEGDGQAVLIRAVEPLGDTDAMEAARPKARRAVDLTNGPGKLCAALGINLGHDSIDLLDRSSAVRLDLTPPTEPLPVMSSTRIGISVAQDTPWRWYLRDNPWVSKPS